MLNARLAGEILERSIAGQIEFRAQLGQAVEPLLNGMTVMALRKAGSVGGQWTRSWRPSNVAQDLVALREA